MFFYDYNNLESDKYSICEDDKNSILNKSLVNDESSNSNNIFLTKKTKINTQEEKNQGFKKAKIVEESTQKIENKDTIYYNKEKGYNRKLKIYIDLIICKEINFVVINNKKIVYYCEKNIQTDSPFSDDIDEY